MEFRECKTNEIIERLHNRVVTGQDGLMLKALSSKPATALANGLAILTAAYTVLSSLIPDWFGELSLPKALLVGFGLALVTMFALAITLAIAAWAYRKFRPETAVDGGVVDAQPYNDAKLRAEVAALGATQRQIVDDYQRMSGLEARFSDEMDKLKESIQQSLETIRSNHAALQDRVVKAEEAHKIQWERTASSLHAIRLREKLANLRAEIVRDAAELSHRVTEGQPHDTDSWQKWENVHHHWWSNMAAWWSVARFYLANSGQVLQAPDHKYPLLVVDEKTLTPAGGAEAVRVYKKFRIIHEQWEAVQDNLDDNICMVAFNGVTEQEVRHGQPLEQGR